MAEVSALERQNKVALNVGMHAAASAFATGKLCISGVEVRPKPVSCPLSR